jgi:peptidylprolyl isomerase/FKBP-type peptidyl-prolyl cis-trans isomerase SlyD
MFKKGDFVKIAYTGTLKENNQVFDTTSEKIAKESGVFSKQGKYEDAIIVLGENHIFPKIDEFIQLHDIGEYELDLEAVDAFGKKSAKLLQLVPNRIFKANKINPYPGLVVNVDNRNGIIKTVNSGRVIVDFNHQLAGHDVHYKVNIKEKIDDIKEQIQAILNLNRIIFESVTVNADVAEIKMKMEMSEEYQKMFIDEIKRLTTVKDVKFIK